MNNIPEEKEARLNEIIERLNKIPIKDMTEDDLDTTFLISMVGGLNERVECLLIRTRELNKNE